MKQILHIFAKDARRFWPEILVSLAVTAAFVRFYPNQWRGTEAVALGAGVGAVAGGISHFLANALIVLIPVSWWLLISRVIHGERLIGHTQFWLTRPYEWKKLFAAKMLFLLTFLYLPLFIAQCLLLATAGFHPLAYLPGLLYNLLLITGIFVLPLVALSSVTSSFAKMTLVLLGAALLVAGIAALTTYLPSHTTGSVASPVGDRLSFVIVFCGCGAVVVLQYALRKTLRSWLVLIAIPVLLCTLAIGDPDQALMNRTYPSPASNVTAPVQLQYVPDQMQHVFTDETRDSNELDINIPLRVFGVADGSLVIPEAVKVAIDAPDGSHWDSPWQAINNQRLLSTTSDSNVRFRVARAAYDKYKSMSVALHLTFALTLTKAEATTQVPLPASDFSVPNFGVCTPQSSWLDFPGEFTSINCKAALRQPKLTYVNILWSHSRCFGPQFEPPTRTLGEAWTGSFDNDPAEFGITSVWQIPLYFSNNWEDRRQGSVPGPRRICVGSPITFTQYIVIGRTQFDLILQDFHLPDLAIGDQYLLRMK